MAFRATLELHGKTATGIEVPACEVERLGAGARPPVKATVAGHTFATTLGVRGGRHLLPVSAEHRRSAGLRAGDEVEVELVLDTAPREVEVPPELAAALDGDPAARERFVALSPSARKRHVLAITSAKTEETRRRRLARVLDELST